MSEKIKIKQRVFTVTIEEIVDKSAVEEGAFERVNPLEVLGLLLKAMIDENAKTLPKAK